MSFTFQNSTRQAGRIKHGQNYLQYQMEEEMLEARDQWRERLEKREWWLKIIWKTLSAVVVMEIRFWLSMLLLNSLLSWYLAGVEVKPGRISLFPTQFIPFRYKFNPSLAEGSILSGLGVLEKWRSFQQKCFRIKRQRAWSKLSSHSRF